MSGHDSGPTPEDCFFSLLGMAEYFRTSQPPRYRLTIHYLTVGECFIDLNIRSNHRSGRHTSVRLRTTSSVGAFSSGKNATSAHAQRSDGTTTPRTNGI